MQARGQGIGGGRGGRFGGGRGMGVGRGGFGGRAAGRGQGWEAVDRSKQACVFFAQGKCTKGDACPFSHANPAEGSVNQAPVSGQPPQPETTPVGRLPPAAIGPPPTRMTTGHNGVVPRTEINAPAGTNGVRLGGSAGFSAQRGNPASAAAAGQNGATSFDQGGGAFAVSPAVVVGGASKATGGSGQARVSASSNRHQEASGHTGIIALPDGGFVTRKRAAELQLGRNEVPETDARQVRQRDGREQSRTQERRPELMAGGSRGAQPGGRVSILHRLGPAKPAPERAAPERAAPTRTRAVAPTRARPEVPVLEARKREGPRQHATPAERQVAQDSSVSSLPRSRGLASALPTRRTESGRSDGVSTSPVARPSGLTQHQKHKKSTALDFKIPTLDEIKSRKAKAEGATKREGKSNDVVKSDRDYAGSKESKPDPITSASGFSHSAVVPDVPTSHSSAPAGTAEAQPPVEVQTPVPVQTPAPAPAPAAHISDPPQLDAEDMAEFSEWLN